VKVSAVVVSRMDRPIGKVLDCITRHVDELIVVRGLGGVWDRWTAVRRCRNEVIYTQDDDVVVDVPWVLAEYVPDFVTCNMPMDWRPSYKDGIALVGWGAVFSASMVVQAFDRYVDYFRPDVRGFLDDDVFRRECDRVFTGLSPLNLIDVPIEHMPWANGDDRMCRRAHDPMHGAYLAEIRKRIYAVRKGR
jgi:hypothetical protein